MKSEYTNWCQGMTSALMSKATMWKGRKKVYVKTCIFNLLIVIKEYLGMAKRSLLYGRPSYFPLR